MSEQPSSLELYELWLMMHQAFHLMIVIRGRELSGYGLSASEAGAMAVIHSLDGRATPSEVARQTSREPHSVSGLVARMCRKGLLNKTPDPGHRNIVRLSLTEKGYEVFWKAMSVESVGAILSALTEQERKQFWTALRKLRQASFAYQVETDENRASSQSLRR